MPRKPYDPLAAIPSPETIRQRLAETLTLAERLKLLLELSHRLNLPLTTADQLPQRNESRSPAGQGVDRG